MSKYIISLDSGTTSCRSLIINQDADIVKIEQLEFTQYFPKSGWVEHDANEIWNTQLTTFQNVVNKSDISIEDIAAIAITNQRETVVAWDKTTGLPIYNAIVWQDRRTEDFCNSLIHGCTSGLAPLVDYTKFFNDKTGLIINPYFSGTKIKWILENVPKAKELLENDNLLVGTIDTWLIWKLTEGKVFATDVSNASRTLLFNIHTLKWDDEILELLNIPKSILPTVKSTSDFFGNVSSKLLSHKEEKLIPITGVVGDQQGALFGSLCHEVGMVKNTYGTGCFCLVNTGNEVIKSNNNLLSTIAWKIQDQPVCYALEGSVFIAGAAIKWLQDELRIIYDGSECDLLISLIKKPEEIFVVPSFTGLGAPYWDSSSRGAIFGIERSTKREHIVKATVDSIGYQTNDLVSAISQDLNNEIKVMRVDGGVSKSKYLMQFQADISQLKIEQLKNTEITALGAAYFAGLYVKFWESVNTLYKINKIKNIFEPKMSKDESRHLVNNWKKVVEKTLNWTKDIVKYKK